ncbi:hypothetical protein PS1_007103 [Malus domestica]
MCHKSFRWRNCGYSYKDQEEIVARTEEPPASDTCPTKEIALDDPELSLEPVITHFYVPPILLPQRLQASTRVDALEGNVPTTYKSARLINLEEIQGESYNEGNINKWTTKIFRDSQIPHREIQPLQRLWVLNTRWKSARWGNKHRWKGTYFFTKIHSKRRMYKKNSTIEFKCTVDKHQLTPYLLLLYDVIKEWLTLNEQVM